MIQMAEQRSSPGRARQDDPVLSLEQIDAYLRRMTEQGRSVETIATYRRNLLVFLSWLPKDRRIDRETLPRWRNELLECGYQPRTINLRLSTVNGLPGYLGLREYQLPMQIKLAKDEIQPELTRNEYLRLLSAAKALGKERTYFLVKVFAATGVSIHGLPRLTAEAVRDGHIILEERHTKQIILLPQCLQRELMDYLQRENIRTGPVFITRSGSVLTRTAVTGCIQQLARYARVAPEKCNPRCLRKLYQATKEGIQQNISLLVEQAHERLLEQEQISIGWEVSGHAQ